MGCYIGILVQIFGLKGPHGKAWNTEDEKYHRSQYLVRIHINTSRITFKCLSFSLQEPENDLYKTTSF